MMRRLVADLHVHTVLSPCAAGEMTPRNIIMHAEHTGVDIIAITDHNGCDNVSAVLEAAQNTKVTVIPGMEVETKEEVHLIALFETIDQLAEWERFIQPYMSGLLNDEKRFGAQFVVDAWDNFVRIKPEMLLTPLSCGIAETATLIKEMGGVCIASHVDRPAYSIISQLGFIPPDVKLDAVEVSRRMNAKDAAVRIPAIGNLPVVTASDAHTIADFISGPKTIFAIAKPTLAEIRMAFCGQASRKVVV